MSEVAPAELRRALSGSMIKAWYQPIVQVADGKPVGLEALARLKDPVRGTVAPDRFVPQIEAAGLAPELTDAIAARAFADLASSSLATGTFSLALNLPLDVLLVPEAIERLEARRKENGLDAARIVVELTESRPVGDLPALRAAIERMRKAGYGLAIDDVGPAVPHYAAMIEMPFTALKLDKIMVQQAYRSDQVRRFVSNTIEAARAHGLKVIAEGVEDMTTWNLVRELGADEAQGFLISRALPVAALPLWLKAWSRRSRST